MLSRFVEFENSRARGDGRDRLIGKESKGKGERRNPFSSMLWYQLARVKAPVPGSGAGKSLL